MPAYQKPSKAEGLSRDFMVDGRCNTNALPDDEALRVKRLFFVTNKRPSIEREFAIAEALSLCFTCKVRFRCLDYALRAGEEHGIWGGTLEDDRRLLLRVRSYCAA